MEKRGDFEDGGQSGTGDRGYGSHRERDLQRSLSGALPSRGELPLARPLAGCCLHRAPMVVGLDAGAHDTKHAVLTNMPVDVRPDSLKLPHTDQIRIDSLTQR